MISYLLFQKFLFTVESGRRKKMGGGETGGAGRLEDWGGGWMGGVGVRVGGGGGRV